jgi:ferredoxin
MKKSPHGIVMNNLFKTLLIILLALLCALLLFTSFRANSDLLTVCPTNAITMQNGYAYIDSLKCIGCGRCALGIPKPFNFTLFPALQKRNDAINEATPEPVMERPDTTSAIPPKPTAIKPLVTKEKPGKAIYSVNEDTCIGCQLCVSPCPVGAITMVNGKAVIDQSKCIGDDICISGNGDDFAGCPVNAISKSE